MLYSEIWDDSELCSESIEGTSPEVEGAFRVRPMSGVLDWCHIWIVRGWIYSFVGILFVRRVLGW